MELAFGCRLLDPECLEEREFLALGFAGVDRQAPRRQAIEFALGDGAEIARAEKDTDLVIIVGLVDRRMKPKAGKAQIHRRAAVGLLPNENSSGW